MVFYVAFNSISVISRLLCLFWILTVLGWGSEVSCSRTLPQENPEDPVWLKSKTLGYESNILPLSHTGPLSLVSGRGCLLVCKSCQ